MSSKKAKKLRLVDFSSRVDPNTALVQDITVPWLYEAHSLTLLFLVIIITFYFAFKYESESVINNIWNGIYTLIFVFLAIGCLVFPAGPYIRPHPIFWRLIFGLSFIYCLLLVMLLFQSSGNGIRKSLKILDSNLGIKPPDKDYATDCTITYYNVMDKMDRFLFAHFIGWFVKAVIIRKRSVLWLLSILWEIIELSTKFFIPNFAECWWDAWLLDVILCNGGGIEFALYLLKKYQVTHFEWHSVFDIDTISGVIYTVFIVTLTIHNYIIFNIFCIGKFKRFFQQFTPFSIEPIIWEPYSSIKRWFHVHFIVLGCTLIDLNAFILKLFLWIPTEHDINLYRLLLVALIALPSAKQYYLFVTNPNVNKLGAQAIMLVLILILELAVCFKASPEEGIGSIPILNIYLWTGGLVIYGIFSFIMLRKYKKTA